MNRRHFFRSLGVATFALTLRLRPETALPVAKDPALLGFTGKQMLESGCVNTPYIPLYTPLYTTQDIRLSDFVRKPMLPR